jgi:hypothetical protein
MNATLGSLFCSMCLHACAPSEPSNALAVYHEDILHVETRCKREMQLCNLEKGLAIQKQVSSVAALELKLDNQTAHIRELSMNHSRHVGYLEMAIRGQTIQMEQLSRNHTEHVGDLNETITELMEQLAEANAALVDSEKTQLTLLIIVAIMWLCVLGYGVGQFCKWVEREAPSAFAKWGARVHACWICTGKWLGRTLGWLGTFLKKAAIVSVSGAMIVFPLFVFKDRIPGLERFEFPTTWLDGAMLALRGVDKGSLFEVAVNVLAAWRGHA